MTNKPGTTGTYIQMVNDTLEILLPPSNESIVCEAMRYSVFNGGKRIRPVLTLEFCRLCAGKPEDALNFACAVEMIHAYSLIHDDLPCMDNDDLRRGKPSCHIKFGEANALLAGDALLTLAFETLFNADRPAEQIIQAGRELAGAAGFSGMIGGQVMDIENEGKTAALDDLLKTDQKKTGRLIVAAAVLGCIAANASKEKSAAVAAYAANIGLAFQLVDDILNITGSTGQLGKTAGSDAVNQKTTYISVMGIEAANQKVLVLTQAAKAALKLFGSDTGYLLQFADDLATRDK